MSHIDLTRAINIIRAGGIIAYPTEAVFGFGCDPDNVAAITRLLEIKQRPAAKGLILIAADWEHLQAYVQPLNDQQMATLMGTWPGPVTWLVPAAAHVSHLIKGDHDTIAVRITAHPIAQQLCQQLHKPLISTSANRSNQPSCLTANDVTAQFNDEIDLIVAGATGTLHKPTEIRDLFTGQILR